MTPGMQSSALDKCLLFRKRPDRKVPEVVVIQVDDTFGSGSDTFLKDEEAQSHQFLSKPRKILSIGEGAMFNGAHIKRDSERSYAMTEA